MTNTIVYDLMVFVRVPPSCLVVCCFDEHGCARGWGECLAEIRPRLCASLIYAKVYVFSGGTVVSLCTLRWKVGWDGVRFVGRGLPRRCVARQVTAANGCGSRPCMTFLRTSTLSVLGLALGIALLFATCKSDDDASRVSDDSCRSSSECAEDLVCSSSGRCETPDARFDATARMMERFGSDGAAYGLWLRYGTAGAQSEPAANDHSESRADASPAASEPLSEALCRVEDIRTDDLVFSHSSWYPDGYWGERPIEDIHSGRCGDDLETMTWRLLNCERITRDLMPVDCDLRLVWIGRQHAGDMASRNYFGHISPEGTDAFRRLQGRGILYGLAGENLARHESIFDAHRAWMGSPLHRRNMLTEHYSYAGIGVVRYGHQLILSEAFLGGLDDSKELNDVLPPVEDGVKGAADEPL